MVLKVESADGTVIAYEKHGSGPPVVIVSGASCDRGTMRPLSEELASQGFAVTCYDRRGRGDSGDTAPYAVEREVEDIAALVAEAGGPASLYGHSSGAGLVLHAAAHGLPLTRIVLHEPPYVPDEEEERRVAQEYDRDLRALLAEDRRGDAMALFMTLTGMPEDVVGAMRRDPSWARMEAVAPTLAYDSEVMGSHSRGGTFPAELARAVGVPGLVVCGGASPAWMIDTARQVASSMPAGECQVLEGQEHVVAPEVLAPVLARYLTR